MRSVKFGSAKLGQRHNKPIEETSMREAEPDTNIATIVVAVLAITGAISFAFAGITIFETPVG